jgi:hypothetical protein
MKVAVGTTLLVAIALGASACGSSHGVSAQKAHLQFPSNVPASLASYIRTTVKSADGTLSSVDVYGPGSRTGLVKASSGAIINESAKERHMRFYLVVLNGYFVCTGCSVPPGSKAPHGRVETHVWSAEERGTDYGIGDSAGPGVSHLHRLATIAVS